MDGHHHHPLPPLSNDPSAIWSARNNPKCDSPDADMALACFTLPHPPFRAAWGPSSSTPPAR